MTFRECGVFCPLAVACCKFSCAAVPWLSQQKVSWLYDLWSVSWCEQLQWPGPESCSCLPPENHAEHLMLFKKMMEKNCYADISIKAWAFDLFASASAGRPGRNRDWRQSLLKIHIAGQKCSVWLSGVFSVTGCGQQLWLSHFIAAL